jgi:hypothetical protein
MIAAISVWIALYSNYLEYTPASVQDAFVRARNSRMEHLGVKEEYEKI